MSFVEDLKEMKRGWKILFVVAGVVCVFAAVTEDFDDVEVLRMKAHLGVVSAQIELGEMYASGRDVLKGEADRKFKAPSWVSISDIMSNRSRIESGLGPVGGPAHGPCPPGVFGFTLPEPVSVALTPPLGEPGLPRQNAVRPTHAFRRV